MQEQRVVPRRRGGQGTVGGGGKEGKHFSARQTGNSSGRSIKALQSLHEETRWESHTPAIVR